jgi:hypothetical protein
VLLSFHFFTYQEYQKPTTSVNLKTPVRAKTLADESPEQLLPQAILHETIHLRLSGPRLARP